MKTTLILVFVLCQISQLTISLEIEFESSNEAKTSLQCDLDLLEDEHAESSGRVKRAGLVQSWWQSLLKSRRWPRSDSGVVIVPYIIQENSHYTQSELYQIEYSMKTIENFSCIRFVRRSFENDFINIYSGNGCFSSTGRIGGAQDVSLRKIGCFDQGQVIHELLHVLGFYHMHSSYDRDNYIKIKYENIRGDKKKNFNKLAANEVSHFGTSYDLDSIMHYSSNIFTNNGLNTIETVDPRQQYRIGRAVSLSRGDIQRINNMYCT